jgi:hypothetical protein
MNEISTDTIQRMWITTLIIYGVVVVVVAVLLTLIVREARRIKAGVSEVWNVGQKIANNTIHVALLEKTNHIAAGILQSAGGVVGATAAIKSHAERCPGCPTCVLGPRWMR